MDAVCQSYSAIQGEAIDYEEKTGKKLGNSIFISVYKSENKITRLYRVRRCYF